MVDKKKISKDAGDQTVTSITWKGKAVSVAGAANG